MARPGFTTKFWIPLEVYDQHGISHSICGMQCIVGQDEKICLVPDGGIEQTSVWNANCQCHSKACNAMQ